MWLLFEQGRVQVAVGVPFAVGAGGCCGLACGQDPAMSDARLHRRLRLPRLRPWSRPPAGSGRFRRKWASISPWVLDFRAVSGGGSFAVGSADLGKRRCIVAFRAGSSCEIAQKLRTGFACVGSCASWRVLRFRWCWSQALRSPVIKDQVGGLRWSACRSSTWQTHSTMCSDSVLAKTEAVLAFA